jgi:hypothetical protein
MKNRKECCWENMYIQLEYTYVIHQFLQWSGSSFTVKTAIRNLFLQKGDGRGSDCKPVDRYFAQENFILLCVFSL